MTKKLKTVPPQKSELRVFYRGLWVPLRLLPRSKRKGFKEKLYNCDKARLMTQREYMALDQEVNSKAKAVPQDAKAI